MFEKLNEMAEAINGLAHEKGWYDQDMTEDSYVEKSCNNLHDEVSELHEAYRNNKLHDLCDKKFKMMENAIIPLTCLEEELADIIIRALDNSHHLGVDIGSAVARKHAFNKTRPYRHGGKKT